MQEYFVNSAEISGQIRILTSKSDAHRAIICGSLANGVSNLTHVNQSDDVLATINAVKATGAIVNLGDTLTVSRGEMFTKSPLVLNCEESGSTLRFLIPLMAAGGVTTTFIGKGRLPERPLDQYFNLLPDKGVVISKQNTKPECFLPLQISGKLLPGKFEIDGNISSQFVSGLLFSLPLLDGNSTIEFITSVESEPYIKMTIKTMNTFGIDIKKIDNGYFIRGNQTYKPCDYTIEGDWSQAAFWLCAGALFREIKVVGLKQNSVQGDKEILNILENIGADISVNDDEITVKPKKLNAITLDAREIPDIIPIIALCASVSNGTTIINNAGRLRHKESDRLSAVCDGICAIGGNAKINGDSLEIIGSGGKKLVGGHVKTYCDHRIIMAFSIISGYTVNGIYLDDIKGVEKSYPNFFSDFKMLGGKLL